jgi:SPX domain protein involved in polyphosphate accumulation
LKKASDFFSSTEDMYRIRKARVWEGFMLLKDAGVIHDKNTWTRLLSACVKFYRDVLLLENFAIMNYCGFSKILKKHDKSTGYVVSHQFANVICDKISGILMFIHFKLFDNVCYVSQIFHS